MATVAEEQIARKVAAEWGRRGGLKRMGNLNKAQKRALAAKGGRAKAKASKGA